MRDDTRITRAIVGALRERDLSGYELWRWLGAVHGTDHELNEATLYPTLYRLEAEGVIEGYWREDGITRRAYRVRSRGVIEADRRGWARIAPRRGAGRLPFDAGPDELLDSIVWGDVAGSGSIASRHAAPAVRDAATSIAAPPAEPDADPEHETAEASIRDWLDAVSRDLRLDDVTAADVRNELADHLHDSVRVLRGEGVPSARAAVTAIAGLGPVDDLARAINAEQRSRDRLLSAIPWPFAIAPLTAAAACALALFWIVAVFVGLTQFAIPLLARAGLHVYVADTAELRMQEVAVAGCLGAFVAGRRSVTSLALRSRRAESTIAIPWALVGALCLFIIIVTAPLPMHPLATATLCLSPLFYVAGTLRPQRINDEITTRRGLAVAAVLLVAGSFVPGVYVFSFDASHVAAAAPPVASDVGPITFEWIRSRNAEIVTVSARDVDPSRWHDVRVEIWPTVRDSIYVEPDESARRPALTLGAFDRFSIRLLSRERPDWLVTVTAAGPDGIRRTLWVEVQLGKPTHVQRSIVGWLRNER